MGVLATGGTGLPQLCPVWVWMRNGGPLAFSDDSGDSGLADFTLSALLPSPLTAGVFLPNPGPHLCTSLSVCASLFAHSPHPSLSCRLSLHFPPLFVLLCAFLPLSPSLLLGASWEAIPSPCAQPCLGPPPLRCGPHLTHTRLKGRFYSWLRLRYRFWPWVQ